MFPSDIKEWSNFIKLISQINRVYNIWKYVNFCPIEYFFIPFVDSGELYVRKSMHIRLENIVGVEFQIIIVLIRNFSNGNFENGNLIVPIDDIRMNIPYGYRKKTMHYSEIFLDELTLYKNLDFRF